jgi:hypothetical protein
VRCFAYNDVEQPIVMNIGWIPGCDMYKSLPADNPMGHSGDNTRNYVALITDTYNSCTSSHHYISLLPSSLQASDPLSRRIVRVSLFLHTKLTRLRIGKGNSGLGGFIDVGCLRYGFYPNDISGVFASPPHPELFWNVYPNICGS